MLKGDLVDDRFSLEELLGHDGLSQVWKARDLEEKREVAVRVLPDEPASSPGRPHCSLKHHNLLALYRVSLHSGARCFITEFADGGSFLQHVENPLSDELHGPTLEWIIHQLAHALLYLHTQNITHGEVRPARIFWDGFIPKLQDVATAHALLQLRPAAVASAAPEIFDGCVSPKADIYALGVTIHQVLTGTLPFTGTDRDMMQGHLNRPVPIAATVSSKWRMLIEGCMEKDPSRRWDAEALLRHLEPHYLEPTGPLIPLASGRFRSIRVIRLVSGKVSVGFTLRD